MKTITLLTLLAGSAASANAAIVSATGPVSLGPLFSVAQGPFASNANVWAFDEAQDVPVFSAIDANLDGTPGTYNTKPPVIPNLILPGAIVSSHFVHFDPFVDTVTLGGSLTFDDPIVAIMVLDAQLDATDSAFGLPTTFYPTSMMRRGLDWDTAPPEILSISPDGKTLSFSLTASNAIDHIRILTAVPTPGVASLFACAGLCAVRRRR